MPSQAPRLYCFLALALLLVLWSSGSRAQTTITFYRNGTVITPPAATATGAADDINSLFNFLTADVVVKTGLSISQNLPAPTPAPPASLPLDLKSTAVEFDSTHSNWHTEVAEGMLLKFREDAQLKVSGNNLKLKRENLAKVNPYWAQLLFPHSSGKYSTESQRGNSVEQERATAFVKSLATSLQREWQRVHGGAVSASPPIRPSTTISSTPSATILPKQEAVLFTTERQFASAAGARLLHLTLLDRGANAPLRRQERYVACVSYDTRGGEYVSKDYSLQRNICPAQPKHVVVSVEFEDLNHNEIFANKITQALKSTNLNKVTVPNEVWEQRSQELLNATGQRSRASRIIDSLNMQPRTAANSSALLKAYGNFYPLLGPEQIALDAYNASTTPATDPIVIASNDISKLTEDDLTALQNLLNTIYNDFVKENTVSDEIPVAGVAEVQRVVRVQKVHEYGDDKAEDTDVFYPDAVRCIIEDGNLEEILVSGHRSDGSTARYETYAPIGMSSDHDLRRSWPRQRLYSHNSTDKTFIKLIDALDYAPILEANGKDRSPADGTYVLHPGDGLRARSLPRLTKARILQGRIYSDLVGLSGDRPNGLLQIEISRKFNWGTPWSKKYVRYQWRGSGYIQPLVALTKAEQANRYLPLTQVKNSDPVNTLYTVRRIDLLRYTTFRVGLDANIFGLRMASIKTDFSFDGSIYLNRVDIKSIRSSTTASADSALNVVMYGLGLKARFRPDSRFGLDYRVGLYRYALINDEDEASHVRIQQQPTVTDFRSEGHTVFSKYWHEGVFQAELLAWVSLSPNSKLFARPQFSFVRLQSVQTYFQFQVGYQIDIFGGSRENATPVNSLWPAAKSATSGTTQP